MNLRTPSILAITLLACTGKPASAQITFVSQNRFVTTSACTPAQSSGQNAIGFTPFGGSASAFTSSLCPAQAFGAATASQNSTLSAGSITSTQSTQQSGNAGATNRFETVFSVAAPVIYTITAGTNTTAPATAVTLVGPGVNLSFLGASTTQTGLLAPGQYTLRCVLDNVAGFANSSIEASFSTLALSLDWSTIDGGGDTVTGGPYSLSATIAQIDAASLAGGNYTLNAGFWPAFLPFCYANCDNSATVPILNALDFSCFLTRYTSALTLPPAEQIAGYANCDGSTVIPALNALDFSCFLTAYRAGCP